MLQSIRLDLFRQRWLIAALGLFFVVIYVQYLLKQRNSDHGMRSALLRWNPQLIELQQGVNIWERHAYPNPPMMALVLLPFAEMPPKVGAALWFGCKSLFALAAVLGVLALLDRNVHPFPWWGKTLAVLMSLRPIEGDLMHGNVNLMILLLIVASVIAYCRKQDLLAGAFIGFGIACKLTPALFVLYFLWKRSWLALGSSILSFAIATFIVPAMAFGWSQNLEFLGSWHDQMIAPYAAGVVSSEHKNQSLPALAYRMLSDEPSFSDYDGDRKIVIETHNIAVLDRTVIQGLVLLCMGAYVIGAMVFCRAQRSGQNTMQILAEYSVVILGMLLFSERTWKHHCVSLLLPFGVMAYVISSNRFGIGFRWVLGLCLTVCCVLMLSTSTGIGDQSLEVTQRFGKLAQVYGAYVWTFFLLLGCMYAILRKSLPKAAEVSRP